MFDSEVVRFAKDKNARRLLVALSGGVDSISLLHKLCELRTRYDLNIVALHVDHQIHPESELVFPILPCGLMEQH
jgi:tRNA(Ile)-lysidine synthase TilS/MesJ